MKLGKYSFGTGDRFAHQGMAQLSALLKAKQELGVTVTPVWNKSNRCLDGLEQLGIHKMHIDVYRDNAAGNQFWTAAGWTRRDELNRFSIIRSAGENA